MTDNSNLNANLDILNEQLETASEDDRFRLLAKRAKTYRLMHDNRAIEDYVDIVDGARESTLICHAQAMLALISIEAQELKEALWWAMSAMNTNEGQFDARMAVGLALDAGELHDAAIPYFRSAVQLDPTSEIAILKLATCCREAMRFSEADDAFRKLMEVSPHNPKYHYEYGWNWQLRHDVGNHYERATELYQKALQFSPNEELKSKIERKIQSIVS